MKKCKQGYYYCYTDEKCKPIPQGLKMTARFSGGGREPEETGIDAPTNGNNQNGNGNGNGGSNGGSNGGGVSESIISEKRDGKSAKDKGYSLRDWFKGGGWKQTGGKYDGKPCAKQPGQTTKPYCRDADDRAAMSKDERKRKFEKKNAEDPNPNRKGKAKMVTQNNSFEPEANVVEEEKKKKRDACYHKVKSRYSVWPSAYASGALVKCRKVGAANWGNSTKKESYELSNWRDDFKATEYEFVDLIKPEPLKGETLEEKKAQKCWPGYEKKGTKKMFGKTYNNCVKKEGYDVGDVDQKIGAVTPIPKDEREAAKQRLLAKTKAKREKMKEEKDKKVFNEFIGTALAGTTGAASAKPKDRLRKAVGSGAGYAVGAKGGEIVGKTVGGEIGKAVGKAALPIPVANMATGAVGKAVGSTIGKVVGGVGGGVAGSVVGNKLAGESKPKKKPVVNTNEESDLSEYAVTLGKTAIRQGIKIGGKRGGRAVQGGLKSGKTATKNAIQTKKAGKGERIGKVVGGVVGGIAGGAAGAGVASVGTGIAGGAAGEKVGAAIGKKIDKFRLKKKEQKVSEEKSEKIDEVVGQLVGGALGSAVGKGIAGKAVGGAIGSAAGEVLDPFKKGKDKNPLKAAAGGAIGGAVAGGGIGAANTALTNKFPKTMGKVNQGVSTIKNKASEMLKNEYEIEEKKDPCWDTHKQVGMKKKGGKMVPNCVPKEEKQIGGGNLKKLAGKATKRIDADTDGDVDTKDMSSSETGEFVPSPCGNKKLKPKVRFEQSDWRSDLGEDWQKVNKSDKTDGMSQKAVNAYRRENPGSKLKTAVTGNPKKGSKDAKRRSSYCSRSEGQKDMHNIDCTKTPDKAICKARRRWKC